MNTQSVTRLLLASACTLEALVGASPRYSNGEELPERTAPQRFFDWTKLQFTVREHRARRERMIASLRKVGGGVFLAPSSARRSGGETFRQLDDFLYFTGLELPDSILAIDADGKRSVLFAPDSDLRFENQKRPNDFPGRPLGTDPSIAKESGIHEVRPIKSFGAQVRSWGERGRIIWLNPGRGGPISRPAVEPIPGRSPIDALLAYLHVVDPNLKTANAFDHIAPLRMIKSPAEIATIRRACTITIEGIRHAASHIRDGVDERLLEGELEVAFKRKGAQRVAFDSIIKSGPNSLWPWRILASHYDRRNRAMHRGELVIFDVGCELNHYASDMGRTFPVSGRFTDQQRRILSMVTAVSDAMIAAIRPGVTLADVQAAGESKIPPEHRKYMQTRHYFGHHIGLSVGDLSLDDALLEPGMIFTVEPWYYNHDEKIAVFIEDDVLVTSTGVENLTKELPRSPEALERMTRRR